ncbi:MAG: glucose sorbosone dehydrogenase [Actinobacteria bacterium HGW-Actinobacteria-4]|nr:MAG: glucose sorbosone dehydrogenase [Actinobacteria bacterium HGW-Actinobacteria-4]
MNVAPRAPLAAAALVLATALALGACASTPSPSPSAADGVIGPITATASPPADGPITAPQVIGGPATVEVVNRADVVTGLAAPWDIEFLPDGALLVSERDAGTIKRVHGSAVTDLAGPGAAALRDTVMPAGEGGLLGLALHPQDSGLLYVYLTREDGNAVVRMSLDGTELSAPTDVLAGIPRARNHDGGRIAFGPDGYLYVATGDAANPPLAQDLDSLAGKILRVVADGTASDGTAAPGNPFGTQVWSYGHRNVQGLGWVADGRMYASELGQNDRDELNLIEPGANYGWPQMEARVGAPAGTALGATVDGLTYPVAEWRTDQASPSGLAITNEGIYMAALRGRAVWRIGLTADANHEPHRLVDDLGRIRHVEWGPDGALYVLTNNTDGRGDPRSGDDRIVRIQVE